MHEENGLECNPTKWGGTSFIDFLFVFVLLIRREDSTSTG